MRKVLVVLAVLGLVLNSCAGAAPSAQPVAPVEVTRVVQVTVPPIEVTRVVQITVPVEVTRVVEQTVAPIVVTATAEPSATPAAGGRLGESATGYGYTLTAEAVTDPAKPNQFYTPKPGTRLVAVTVVLANEQGEVRSSNLLNAVLIDAEGFTYEAGTGQLDEQIELIDLRPGNKVRGAVGFEIPEQAQPARLRWTVDGSLGDQFLEVGLAKAGDVAAGGATEAAVAPTATVKPAAKPGATSTADAVVAAFKAAGLEAEQPQPLTKDDYGLAPLVGSGLRFLVPSLCADCGGRVFVVPDDGERARLKGFYEELLVCVPLHRGRRRQRPTARPEGVVGQPLHRDHGGSAEHGRGCAGGAQHRVLQVPQVAHQLYPDGGPGHAH